jgi:hypothetical protein
VPFTTSINNNTLLLEHTLEKHHRLYPVHGKAKLLVPTTSSTFDMPCHPRITHATKKHALSCCKVKEMIHKNNKCEHNFPNRHGLKRDVDEHHTNPIHPTMPLTKRMRLAYPMLEQTLSCTDIEHKQAIENTSTMHVHVTTTSLTSDMPFHPRITHATKKHALSCRKFKEMIRENNKCEQNFPNRHGLKRDVDEHHTNPIDPTMPLTKRLQLTYPMLEKTP